MEGGRRRKNIIRVVVIDIEMRKIDIVIEEMDIGRRKGRGIEMMRNIDLRNDIAIETILKGNIEIKMIIDLKNDLETTTDIAQDHGETTTSNHVTPPPATTKTGNETDPPTVVPPPPSATDNTTAPPTVVVVPPS
jgi:hypothetical protein